MMAAQYIIMKMTRMIGGDVPKTHNAYSGPTCDRVGVLPGQVYANLEDAKTDARKMNPKNGTGFVIYRVGVPGVVWSIESNGLEVDGPPTYLRKG